MDVCIKNNITITINNLSYLNEIIKQETNNLKVHIKLNTGMNRLGTNNKDEFNKMYQIIKNSDLILEGIYTHIYDANNKDASLKQLEKFKEITNDINLKDIPIVHICASDAILNDIYEPFINGCRLGIAMYGLCDNKKLKLHSTFSLYSEVIQINEVENETVGYNGAYKVNKKEKIAVVSIGYADGIIRKNTNRYVYINNKPYKIVGNICMDMLFVKVDDSVKVNDKVVIIKDNEHIKEIAKHLDTITYEILCSVGKRVPRKYI